MKTRIAIYGGANLQPAVVRFAGRLTRRLLEFPDVVVVSGGFGHYKRHPKRVSVDRAVAEEAVALLKRCLVLMPFGRGHDGFYRSVLRSAIHSAGFVARRIDKDEYSGNIPTLFLSSLERAHAVLVDVTGANPNVMYELGHVHARAADPPAVILRQRLTPMNGAAAVNQRALRFAFGTNGERCSPRSGSTAKRRSFANS